MKRTSRSFNVLDGMVLVAATALGIALYRALDHRLEEGNTLWLPVLYLPRWAWRWGLGSMPIAAAWTPALALLRARQPRPTPRRLARQPGWVANVAASSALVIGSLSWGFLWATAGRPEQLGDPVGLVSSIFFRTLPFVGVSVAASWRCLGLGGRWQAERSWIDRAGRALGWYWVVTFPLSLGLSL